MRRIGVFVCHCGVNIAATVKVKRVLEEISMYENVVYCVDYVYMCSDPGQEMIRDAIKEEELDGIVIAACSPNLHEITFRRVMESVGLNPYQCECANIREQCSWVHVEGATEKAIAIIKGMVEKVKLNESLSSISVPITRRAIIIGGGISGIQAALDIANSGYEVVLVEKEPSIGGHMAQLSETFPTLDCSSCILTPKMVEVSQHDRIKLLTYAEVEEVEGYVGNFNVKVKKKPRYVDEDKCTGCDLCAESPECMRVCPVGAIKKDEKTGIFKIDEKACKSAVEEGCAACVEACEYGGISIPPGYDHAVVCDLCGGSPECVEVCPTDALKMVVSCRGVRLDPDKCTGCRICELVCSSEKEGVFSPTRSQIHLKEEDASFDVAIDCRFCRIDTPCVEACPVDALKRDEETNTVRITGLCAAGGGCRACVDACEYGGIKIVHRVERHKSGGTTTFNEYDIAVSCDLCDGKPKCIELCPTDALELDVTYEGLDFDPGKCTGCRICELVCSIEKDGVFNPKKSRIHVKDENGLIDIRSCKLCRTCPVLIPDEFDMGLRMRKAIYIPFPQAVPLIYSMDKDRCVYCEYCKEVCEPKAINFFQKTEEIEIEVGAIIVATGYELYPKRNIGEYGYGIYEDVIDGLQFERLLSASGPTQGEIRRPSDGKVPREVVFVQCVGSRDPKHHLPYCSKICCMYTLKHAMLYKHRVPDGQAYIFYIDIRAGGKGYEEFVQRGVEEDGVLYIRGMVSKIFQDGDEIIVWGADTLTGRKIEIAADMVVLAMAMVPGEGIDELVKKLKISADEYGFLTEAHPKLRPVESLTPGIFLAGCAQAPKDIPETVAQASGAASKVVAMFSGEKIEHEPIVVGVDEELCRGCGICVQVCPYDACTIDPESDKVSINEVLCEGCGSCVSACLSGAVQQNNFTDSQILEIMKSMILE
jgi:heterodisulfide reductase subunit A-like polyferredoxin